MSVERRSKVFPEIPHYPPHEEDTRLMPTPHTTTFFTPFEKKVMGNEPLLTRVEQLGIEVPIGEVSDTLSTSFDLSLRTFEAKNSAERKQAVTLFLQFAGKNYPQNYAAVRGVLVSQINSTEIQTARKAKDALSIIDEEYKTSEHTSVRIRFESHGIKDATQFDSVVERMWEEMGQVFKRDEKNIFFKENHTGIPKGYEQAFEKAYAKFGSFQKADIFFQYHLHLKREPTEKEFQEAWEGFPPHLRKSGDIQGLYNWAIYTALDRYAKEGYVIKWVSEKGAPKYNMSKIAQEEREKYGTTANFMRSFLTRTAPDIIARNAVIATQISDIEKEAEKSKTKTNVLLLLGTNHYRLVDELPLRMGGVVTSTQEDRKKFDVQREIIDILVSGGKPSETLWEMYEKEMLPDDLVNLLK